MKIYAVVHDGNGRFLMARKTARSYFFRRGCEQDSNGAWRSVFGAVNQNGPAPNGAGLDALPGGGLEGNDWIFGAMEEFFEETNVLLAHNPACPVSGVATYPPVPQNNAGYGAVYFQVSPADLTSLRATITQNLLAAAQFATDVQGLTAQQIRRPGREYRRLLGLHPQSPMDNELASIRIMDKTVPQHQAIIAGWNTGADKDIIGWYTTIIGNMP